MYLHVNLNLKVLPVARGTAVVAARVVAAEAIKPRYRSADAGGTAA